MNSPPVTIRALRAERREEALRRGINPRDVDLLLGDLLGRSLPWLISHGDEPADAEALDAMLARRYAGEPIQYIRGRSEFYGRDFYVDDRVLIPRPETELLVEATLDRAPRGARVVDVGTGSGCIALSLALERSDLRVLGVDKSIAALAVAKRNRDRLEAPAHLAASDLLESIRKADVIVSNPPYIAEADVETLATEVREYEPHVALTPGPRGTEAIEQILDRCRVGFSPPGRAEARPTFPLVLMEVGFGQEQSVRDVAAAHGFTVDDFLNDLAGIPRVVVLSRDGE
ncbi:MAG TPA: peptide chain release factor N(5)-glutamine methyltransferase [Thermoanaerobaculia bacterium]|nr:peptide chain release factor N(5)-glutamine methyltransferase [Thermoanaerobaculia bacterium]